MNQYNDVNLKMTLLSVLFMLLCLFTAQTLCAADLSPYSNKELEQLEKEFVALLNQSDSVDRNPLANQYINHLGTTLANNGHMQTPHFFIVKSHEINAFAGPGGHIGINTQLILTTGNESELAAVMAHELAHAKLHHLYSQMDHQKQMRVPALASMLAAAALGVINPTVGLGAMMAGASGFSQDGINFIRAKEKEADRIGIAMLIKAGYNPKGMAQFFKKMQENMRYYYTANVPAILRTHPMDEERIAEAENRTAKLAPSQYKDSLDYFLFKELIRVSTAANTRQILDYYEHQCHEGLKKTGALSSLQQFACTYGHANALMSINQFQKAITLLNTLNQERPDSIYVSIAKAQALLGNHETQNALNSLERLYKDYPDNYAILMAYADGLLSTNHAQKAEALLLKGSRRYQYNTHLCQTLAQAQAALGKQSYAYFTQAQCLLLEGQKRGAMSQLKTAQKLARKDAYLSARIKAKMIEIQE